MTGKGCNFASYFFIESPDTKLLVINIQPLKVEEVL